MCLKKLWVKGLTKQVYLNKFVFNNRDANKNYPISIINNVSSLFIVPNNVINFTKGADRLNNLATRKNNSITQLLESIENSHLNEVTLTNAVIKNLNLAYECYIINAQLQSQIPKLALHPIDNFLLTNYTSPCVQILNIFIRQYGNANNRFKSIDGHDLLINTISKGDIYLQIKIGSWNYLSANNNKYLCLTNTCVYAYLGVTS